MSLTVILDIDGTLVDTNYQHALCWFRALRQHDQMVPVSHVHRHIGMGGDQIVAALTSDQFERDHGDDVRAAEGALYKELMREVAPLPGAREFVRALKGADHTVILASSAKADEVDHYLDLLEAREVVDDWTTSAEVEATKPEPDLIQAALAKAEQAGGSSDPRDAVMIGDATWDCIAAGKAGVRCVAVMTGGFGRDELLAAGASDVIESVDKLGASFASLVGSAG